MTRLISRFSKPTLLLLCCCGLWACSTHPVSYDYDPAIDFVAFKSYRWLNVDQSGQQDPRIRNDLMDQRIKRAIDAALMRRHYIRRDASAAQKDQAVDFLVTYQIAIEKRTDVDEIETGIGFGYRFMDLGFRTQTIVREYDEITLYIDMIQPGSEKLIWRGMRTYRYLKGGSVAERDERVQAIVGEILGGFPPARNPAAVP